MFDGEDFFRVEASSESRQKHGKTPRKNGYEFSYFWRLRLLEKNIAGNIQGRSYSFPPLVLNYVRALVPGDIVVKFREGEYQVTLKWFLQTYVNNG